MDTYDVAVAGAGIIGSSIAYACAAAGASVVLLERDSPGSGASGMAAGMLAPCSESDAPGPFLELARHSLGLWPELAQRLCDQGGIDPELTLCGVLRVAVDESDVEAVHTRIGWQRDAGVAVRWLAETELVAAEPALRRGRGAAWYADEGHVNSAKAVGAFIAAARANGATLRSGCEVIDIDGRGVHCATGETVACGTAVLCGGPWVGSGALGGVPLALPLHPVRGQLIGVRGLPTALTHVVYAGQHGYALSRRDGLTLVGTTEETAGFDGTVRDEETHRLRATGRFLLRDFARALPGGTWAGLRPASDDGGPLLGHLVDVGATSVLVACGHYRNGVLLAPATAEGIAATLAGGASPPGWKAFDPHRFG